MECTFSDPQKINDISSLDAWAYSHMSCIIPTASPAAVASPSAYIDITPDSALSHAMFDVSLMLFVIAIILIAYAGLRLGFLPFQ